MKFLVLFLFVFHAGNSLAQSCRQQFPKVDGDLTAAELRIKTMDDAFSKLPEDVNDQLWVKKKLQQMFDVDQYVRGLVMNVYQRGYTQPEMQCAMSEFVPRMSAIDAKDTSDMKGILKVYGWIKISGFGDLADNQAWLIVQHADQDPQFQKSVLAILEKLWPLGETSPKNFAYLFDRVASSWIDPLKRVPQRYGTQGQCHAPGDWGPLQLEDVLHLDDLRAQVGLPPFAEYKKIADTMCH